MVGSPDLVSLPAYSLGHVTNPAAASPSDCRCFCKNQSTVLAHGFFLESLVEPVCMSEGCTQSSNAD